MDAAAEGRKHADAPVAQFIAAALNHHGAIIGNGTGGSFLIGKKLHQVFRSAGIKIVLGNQTGERSRFWQGA